MKTLLSLRSVFGILPSIAVVVLISDLQTSAGKNSGVVKTQ